MLPLRTTMIKTALVTALAASALFAIPEGEEIGYRGVWDAEAEYSGFYKEGVGDTVQHGEINGRKMYWWAKFHSINDVPGAFAPEGETSPWVLINSTNYSPTGTDSYQWKGWNGQMAQSLNAGGSAIPTWRNGAEGAYTIIQDDIGAIPHTSGIEPGYKISMDYPDIRTGWGVFVRRAEETNQWANMRKMVRDGHEMVCHSYDHTSAAEQWAIGDIGEDLPTSLKDPSIPKILGGLTVVGAPTPAVNPNDWPTAYTRQTVSTPLGTIEYSTNWTGGGPASNIGETVMKEDVAVLMEAPVITPAADVEIVELLGVKYYVKYTERDTINGCNKGYALASKVGWIDYEEGSMDQSYQADNGMAVWVFKCKSQDSWADRDCYKREIFDANTMINENVYDVIKQEDGHFGRWFNAEKQSEYYVYPYDAYSEITHDSIMNRGFVAARGGAKSGMPMQGDFYHPNRIDFDAFFMADEFHTVVNPPDNPHSLLTIQGMVDEIIASKGYMIRELHAIVDVGNNWEDVNDNGKGGWWGGITTALYRQHMDYLQENIDANKLTIFTPSEAVRYRMTANNATGATMRKEGDAWNVSVDVKPWANGDNRWEDEISVVIKLDAGVDKLDVTYAEGSTTAHPYNWPKKLNSDGSAWAINFNPYVGSAMVYPGRDWTGPDNSGGSENTVLTAGGAKAINFNATIQSGKLKLQLPKGGYSVQLYSVTGKLLRQIGFASDYDNAVTALPVEGLAQGVVIMKLLSADQALLTTESMIVK